MPTAKQRAEASASVDYLAMWEASFTNGAGVRIWVDMDGSCLGKTAYEFSLMVKTMLERGWLKKYAPCAYQLIHTPSQRKA